mgnify:FL=1
MAFKMKRPIIKGTPLHQESIVAQTRTQADPSLATAASELGRSRVGKSIDYNIDPGRIKFGKVKKKKGDPDKKIIPAEEVDKTEVDTGNDESKKDENQIKADDIVNETEEIVENLDPEKETKVNKLVEFIKNTKDKIEKKIQEKKDDRYVGEGERENRYQTRGEYDPRRDAEGNKIQEEVVSLDQKKVKSLPTSRKLQEILDPGPMPPTPEPQNVEQEISSIEPRKIESMPVDTSEPNFPEKVDIPESKGPVDADKNPNYEIGKGTTNIEGGTQSVGGVTSSPGYSYNVDGDNISDGTWTYNGFPISEDEVSTEVFTAIMEDVKNQLIQEQSGVTSDVQPEPTVINTTPSVTEQIKTKVTIEKPNKKDFKNSSDYMRARMRYLKAIETQDKTSAMQMRDDRIFANATPDGVLRKNMIESGYIPPNQR